jgi:fluoroquinolone resistance protein
MKETYIQDQTFEQCQVLARGEYENCLFRGCDLSETNLSQYSFIACTFDACNLSLAKLLKTLINDVHFKDCKMLGLRFDNCNPVGLSFSFTDCQLQHASFYRIKSRKTRFSKCQLVDVDFAEADFMEAVFADCDLSGAIFDHTVLDKADFRTAYHFSLDPENNRIKKARFSLSGLPGLLEKYEIKVEG